ncbi:MAG: DUF362 domain-containing protein [Phycisphaerae bacterium]
MDSIPITPVRRTFPADRLTDIEASVSQELVRCGVDLQPGSRIAIAVGSRGIAELERFVRAVVHWVRQCGAEPFIVPAMGSHGGATAEGQRAVLAGYGVTEENLGCPVRSSMEVIELPQGDLPTRVFLDRHAASADGTILINRVKMHTSFRGRYESGLMKMIAIGLGKYAQAQALHRLGIDGLREMMPRVAGRILTHGNILLGLAIVENAYDQPMLVRAIRAPDIPVEEPALLDLARANMPALPLDQLDVLIVDQIGKDISGLGMDPNVIGRLKIRGQPEPRSPDIRVITIHDLSAASHGNAIGMGLADIATRRLFNKIDFKSTYANVLTTTFLERAKIPIIAETDREAVRMASQACAVSSPDEIRLIRIRNTLRLDELQVSSAVLNQIRTLPGIEVSGPVESLFDSDGTLRPWK